MPSSKRSLPRRRPPTSLRRSFGLTSALLAALAFLPSSALAQTATEQFAENVFLKNLVFTDKTDYLDGTFDARCKRVKARRPTATCKVTWSSDHATFSGTARFRGAVKIGPPFRNFTWRFRVTRTCVGDSCAAVEPDQRQRRYTWKGKGINTPA